MKSMKNRPQKSQFLGLNPKETVIKRGMKFVRESHHNSYVALFWDNQNPP
jgi:hypothetical protein